VPVLTGPVPPTAATGGPVGILDRQRARESSARTYARSFPIVPVRAHGMTVIGADGRRYLDCLSGAGALALGHNHPEVVAAIRRTLDRGAPMQVLDIATPEKDEFVNALFATLPEELAARGRIHFCGPAGTDAVEAALKLAQHATGRRGLLAFTGAYHGMTAAALAAGGGIAAKEPVAGVAAEVTRLPYPHPYRCPLGLGGEAAARLCADYVGNLLADPCGGVAPPAAMILEAVQGEGGVVPAPDGWLREMRRITAAHGVPLIVDEVQTGLGRTGALWACEHSGVIPDAIVMSKAIGGGLPMAVVVYDESLDGWAPGAHTGTFRGTTMSLAAGAATMRVVMAEGLHERAAELGERLMERLSDLAGERPSIGHVRGRGLMVGVELVEPDGAPDRAGARPPCTGVALRARSECLRRGLIVELGGRHDAVLRLLPPLVMTDAEADAVLERLAEALEAAERGYLDALGRRPR
jgi:diaminobutyrate-2-oxoglutarate transaminase